MISSGSGFVESVNDYRNANLYKTKPGKRSQFLEIFRSKSIPAHTEIGMKILGPFLSVEDPNTFFFMRGFPDLLLCEPMKAKFYEGNFGRASWRMSCYQCWEIMKSSLLKMLTASFAGSELLRMLIEAPGNPLVQCERKYADDADPKNAPCYRRNHSE